MLIKFDNISDKYINQDKEYTIINQIVLSSYTRKKPNILDNKILDKNEQEVVEFSLKANERSLIHKELIPIKNDYQDECHRGMVEYTQKCKNYSYHTVEIPDNLIIKNTNFCQKEPGTKAISGKNIIFIDCNLVNNDIDNSWTLQSCNISQIKRIKKSEETFVNSDGQIDTNKKKITISNQIEDSNKKGTFIEVSEDIEIVRIGDDYELFNLRLNI